MLVKILPMKQDLFIIIIKKIIKEFMVQHQYEDMKELREEGIDTEIMPWIEDKNN